MTLSKPRGVFARISNWLQAAYVRMRISNIEADIVDLKKNPYAAPGMVELYESLVAEYRVELAVLENRA